MQLFKINTTAFEEEDFQLVTDLSEKEIVKVIKPIVKEERKGKSMYDNDMLVESLRRAYPNNVVIYYQDGGDEISI